MTEITIDKSLDKRLGILLVGMGGNNGSTFIACIEALKQNLTWKTKQGIQKVDLLGSLYGYGTIDGFPIKDLIPLYNPANFIVSGWDICGDDIQTACINNSVLEPDLLAQLDLSSYKPMPSIYDPSFVASNQSARANNIKGSLNNKWTNFSLICSDIQSFKIRHNLSKVVVIWTASTERMSTKEFLTPDDLIGGVYDNDPEISPSMLFALASCYNHCIFINGSPQNTIQPGLIEVAKNKGAFIAGEDFKTGQTKLKSVLVDYLVSSGIRPLSIVSYNHLGNNDGYNLSEQAQFKSKETSKSGVIEDIIRDNKLLFEDRKPDHCVVIKYVEAVGDTKRAMDEYYSEIALGGRNTLAINNTCEDSLLAVPIMIDLAIFSEFLSRVKVNGFHFHPTLSLLSFYFKAPKVSDKEEVVNAFFPQLYALKDFIRLCIGLPPPDYVKLSSRLTC